MFDRQSPNAPHSTSAADTGSLPAERVMRIAPLDLRQQRFKTSMRGFDKTEVVAFLTEAADDYEHALREIDRLRQDLMRMEALLTEHRDREANLRNTLLTAQRLADGVPAAALHQLSMGMSHDFEAAIEEGATLVRVGTAIFGKRTPPVQPTA